MYSSVPIVLVYILLKIIVNVWVALDFELKLDMFCQADLKPCLVKGFSLSFSSIRRYQVS